MGFNCTFWSFSYILIYTLTDLLNADLSYNPLPDFSKLFFHFLTVYFRTLKLFCFHFKEICGERTHSLIVKAIWLICISTGFYYQDFVFIRFFLLKNPSGPIFLTFDGKIPFFLKKNHFSILGNFIFTSLGGCFVMVYQLLLSLKWTICLHDVYKRDKIFWKKFL